MFVGLALLFAGLAAYVHNDLFLRKAETVPGIVTEKRMHRNHATCTIFVDYEVDGKHIMRYMWVMDMICR